MIDVAEEVSRRHQPDETAADEQALHEMLPRARIGREADLAQRPATHPAPGRPEQQHGGEQHRAMEELLEIGIEPPERAADRRQARVGRIVLDEAIRERPRLQRVDAPKERRREQRAEEHHGGEVGEDFGDLFQGKPAIVSQSAVRLH